MAVRMAASSHTATVPVRGHPRRSCAILRATMRSSLLAVVTLCLLPSTAEAGSRSAPLPVGHNGGDTAHLLPPSLPRLEGVTQNPLTSVKSDDAAAALDITGCYRQDGSGNGFDKPVYGHAGHVYLKQDGRNVTGCISQFCFSTLDGDLTVTENEVGMLRLTRHGGNCTAGRLENGSVIPGIAYFLFIFPRGYAGEPTTGSFVNNWESRGIPGHAGWLSLNKTVEEECTYMRHASCMGPL